MPKRAGSSRDPPASSGSEPECENQAKRLIQAQKDQQKKRRTANKKGTDRTRTSVWNTHCATKLGLKKPSFRCNVCSVVISTNITFSSSNVKTHYERHHPGLHSTINRLQAQNGTESMLETAVQNATQEHNKRKSNGSILSFIRPAATPVPSEVQASQISQVTIRRDVPVKTFQAVILVLYSCYMEIPVSKIATPIFQGLVDMFDGRVQFTSKASVDPYFIPTYKAICGIIRRAVTSALTGSITLDGWSAALGTPILGMMWHFTDDNWNLRNIPVCALNTGPASKSGEQLRCIVEEQLQESMIIGSSKICVHTITSDNEPSVSLAVDLLTNYVGSVRCVVHTIALVVNDVFETSTPWQRYLDHINKVTTYFNYHSKASMFLQEAQKKSGVTNDRLHRLKHDVPTRWHSRLGAMLTYITEIDNISAVAEQLEIGPSDIPPMNTEQRNTLAEFIYVLSEVRRVARQLEADQKVTMSRAPRLLRELFETLHVMAGSMTVQRESFYSSTLPENDLEAGDDDNVPLTFRAIPSNAEHCNQRDAARGIILQKSAAKQLAQKIAHRLSVRLGTIWKPVEDAAVEWEVHDDIAPPPSMRAARRVLLFHTSAVLDPNECELEFLQCSVGTRMQYLNDLYHAIAREIMELEEGSCQSQSPFLNGFSAEELKTIFGLFRKKMRKDLSLTGRKCPQHALNYWRDANKGQSPISPVPFNKIARASFSSQASSASAERLFSDLGRTEGRQRQSLLTSSLEMASTIRCFVQNELKDSKDSQKGLLHAHGVACKRICMFVASEVVQN